MRILVLTPTFFPVVGGAEMVIFEVYRRLARRHEVRLLTPELSVELRREAGSDEYDALVPFPVERYRDRISFMHLRGHGWSAGLIPPFSLSAVAAVRSVARVFRPDVLNVHYVMPTGLAGLVAERWLRIPTVLTVNGRDAPGPGVPRLWRAWQRALLALVTDATYVSDYCREALNGAGRGGGHVVYAGVEIPPPAGDGTDVRRALCVPPGDVLVFALQRLALEKRVDVLLHALRACLDARVPTTLVVGGRGSEESRLRMLAGELGVEKQTRFVGYIPRAALGSYFAACDVFAFHSTFETFGIVVAQAMSYGRPVVAARNTALPEVVGEAGLLVGTGDARGFAEAITRLARDPELRRTLGAAGCRRAEALFNWDRIADQYEALLGRAAARDRLA
jgi:glycosyltransferase involved in cell wall biosynthesis